MKSSRERYITGPRVGLGCGYSGEERYVTLMKIIYVTFYLKINTNQPKFTNQPRFK